MPARKARRSGTRKTTKFVRTRAGSRSADAAHRSEAVREPARVRVILGQPLDHAVGTILERHEARRREDADLAHAPADHLARPARATDEVPAADDDRPDRAGETLRQAERGRVRRPRGAPRRTSASATTALNSRAPSTWSGTPCSWAIAAIEARVGGVERLAARVSVRVLEDDERRQGLMQVGRVAEGGADRVRIHRARRRARAPARPRRR